MAIITSNVVSISRYLLPYRKGNILRTCIRKFSIKSEEQNVIEQIFPEVEGSPASIPHNYLKYPKTQRKPAKQRPEKIEHTGHIIIECKNKELNHYINHKYDKLEAVPLASKGWQHRKSKGDYFKINIYPDKEKRESIFWIDGVNTYEGLGLDNRIVEAVHKMGFTRPTNIQVSAIPEILSNQNTLIAGETGCGKTLAFLLPVIQEILQWRSLVPERKLNTPLALVLVPGRELAHQIGDVADKLAQELMFDLDVVVGGHSKRLITHPNFKPVDLLVSSTGVASKLTTTGVYNMSLVRHVVLDEADTLLDDSFNDALVRYLKKFRISYGKGRTQTGMIPEFCQLTMVGATIPTGIHTILDGVVSPDSIVKVETPRLHRVLCNVPQRFFRLGQSEKISKLLEITKRNAVAGIPTVIFSNRSKACDWVSMCLNEHGVSCINLNGDMPADIRSGRFDQFQRGMVDIISCTDVAGRGLDTVRAKHVINFDFPVYMADYIHRCGRVGRVGHTEDCLITNFVAGVKEIELAQKIELSVRTMSTLPNVNANITSVIFHRAMKRSSYI